MVKITGDKRFTLRLDNIGKNSGKEVFKVLANGADAVLNTGNQLMTDSPRSGRVYTKPGGRIHKASAPGEPPAPDTGRLRVSGRTGSNEAELTATVTWSTEYAVDLEVGTSTMGERPFAAPALAQEKPDILKRAAEAVERVAKTNPT